MEESGEGGQVDGAPATQPPRVGQRDESRFAGPCRLSPGASFGEYEVIALLHRGAYIEVYRAKRGGELVSLKVPPVERELHERDVERFRTEAESASLVRHPHLVRVREVGVVEGVPFLSTDLLSGTTLGARLESDGAFDLTAAADLLLPLLSALVTLRGRNVAHGEMKPQSVMLTTAERGDHPWLVDFGIAKRDPIDDRRRDTDAVGALLLAMLVGEGRVRDCTPESLGSALRDVAVPPELVAALVARADVPPSVRQIGRAMAASASPGVRALWANDFHEPTADGHPADRKTPIPRSARRAFGLLVVLVLMIVGLWFIRARLRPSMRTPITDRPTRIL